MLEGKINLSDNMENTIELQQKPKVTRDKHWRRLSEQINVDGQNVHHEREERDTSKTGSFSIHVKGFDRVIVNYTEENIKGQRMMVLGKPHDDEDHPYLLYDKPEGNILLAAAGKVAEDEGLVMGTRDSLTKMFLRVAG